MSTDDRLPGAARLQLAEGVALLHPQEQVFEAMVDGSRNQQLARNLALSTIDKRIGRLRTFLRHAEAFPWQWSAQHADEWFGDLRSVHGGLGSGLAGQRTRGVEAGEPGSDDHDP
ncbi:hypothetical protein AB0K48_61165, partial [Nonomuraea sp. NPDC055795]